MSFWPSCQKGRSKWASVAQSQCRLGITAAAYSGMGRHPLIQQHRLAACSVHEASSSAQPCSVHARLVVPCEGAEPAWGHCQAAGQLTSSCCWVRGCVAASVVVGMLQQCVLWGISCSSQAARCHAALCM